MFFYVPQVEIIVTDFDLINQRFFLILVLVTVFFLGELVAKATFWLTVSDLL